MLEKCVDDKKTHEIKIVWIRTQKWQL